MYCIGFIEIDKEGTGIVLASLKLTKRAQTLISIRY